MNFWFFFRRACWLKSRSIWLWPMVALDLALALAVQVVFDVVLPRVTISMGSTIPLAAVLALALALAFASVLTFVACH